MIASFLIVHGGWGGGWEWTDVGARSLRGRGHDVFTPTLAGMGERWHLGHREVEGSGTHVEDILAVLDFEDIHDVILCGASYGGMPVTGAANRPRGAQGWSSTSTRSFPSTASPRSTWHPPDSGTRCERPPMPRATVPESACAVRCASRLRLGPGGETCALRGATARPTASGLHRIPPSKD